MAPGAGPVRTCVGCRARAPKATLLRVVAVGDALVPDPSARLPGRGASVHPDLRCVELAERRRAFPRALRLAGASDVAPVRAHVAALVHEGDGPQGRLDPQALDPQALDPQALDPQDSQTAPPPAPAGARREQASREQHSMSQQ